jgi:hypothetical protein
MFSSESEILEAAVAGIPRLAKTIAEIPTALRERAFEAVERSYQRTVQDLGHAEADAQIWTSAVMCRLRSQVAGYEEAGGSGAEAENFVKIRKRGWVRRHDD